MTSGQSAQRIWRYWRNIKPWYFLALALVSAVVCVFALRANNLKMVELREAVFQADQQNGDVEGALRDLRAYVYGHMNTNLAAGSNVKPPIQLVHTYERLVAARKAGAQATGDSSDLYTQAQQYCEKAIPNGFSGSYRLSCIQSFVKQRSGAGGVSAPTTEAVPKNLYQFDFISPSWSPDLAGWSLVATVVFFIAFVLSWIFRRLLQRSL